MLPKTKIIIIVIVALFLSIIAGIIVYQVVDNFESNESNESDDSNKLVSCNNLPAVNTMKLPNKCSYFNAKYAMCNKHLLKFFDYKPTQHSYNLIKKYHVYNDLYSGVPAFDINTLPKEYFEKIINDKLKEYGNGNGYDNDYENDVSIFIGKTPLSFIPDTKLIPSDAWHIYHTGLYLVPFSKMNEFNIGNYEHLITTLELWGMGSVFNGINVNLENDKYRYNFPFKGLMQVPYLFGCSNNEYFLKPKNSNSHELGYNTHLEYLITVPKQSIFKLREHLMRWTDSNNKYILPSFLKDYACVTMYNLENRDPNLDYNFCRICDTFCMTSIKFLCNHLRIEIPCNIMKIKFNDVQFIYEDVTIITDDNIQKYLFEIKLQNKILEDVIKLFTSSHKLDLTQTRNTHHNSYLYILIKYMIDNNLFKSPHIYLTFNHNNKATLGRFKLIHPYLKVIYDKCSFGEFLLHYN